jgi:acetyl-CoA carboxylase carboxyltransferase component
MPVFSSGRQIPLARIMAFVDGGYLRSECLKRFDENINFQALKQRIVEYFNGNSNGKYDGDLVRVYYYDAIVDVDTLWRDKNGNDFHWKGIACKVYTKTNNEWKLITHTGLLDYSLLNK